eukprot:scaffold41244_cov62-Phaeocystis_antarctica.AAC.8
MGLGLDGCWPLPCPARRSPMRAGVGGHERADDRAAGGGHHLGVVDRAHRRAILAQLELEQPDRRVHLLLLLDGAEAGRDGDHRGVRRPALPHLAQHEGLACGALLDTASTSALLELLAPKVEVEAADALAPVGHGGAVRAGGLGDHHRNLKCQRAVTKGEKHHLQHVIQRHGAELPRNDTPALVSPRKLT